MIIELKKIVLISTQFTHETDHILNDSKMSSALNFCFLCILLSSKEKDHIRRNMHNKEKEMFTCEIIIIILICQKLGSVGPVQQKK